MKFEHRFISTRETVEQPDTIEEEVEITLDNMSREGWELVTAVPEEGGFQLFWKRPVEE